MPRKNDVERTEGLDGLIDRVQLLLIQMAVANKKQRKDIERRTQQQDLQVELIQREIDKLEPKLERETITDNEMLALVILWDSRRFYAEEHYELREAYARLQLMNVPEIDTVRERADILDVSIIVE